jgi:hypothetical protein
LHRPSDADTLAVGISIRRGPGSLAACRGFSFASPHAVGEIGLRLPPGRRLFRISSPASLSSIPAKSHRPRLRGTRDLATRRAERQATMAAHRPISEQKLHAMDKQAGPKSPWSRCIAEIRHLRAIMAAKGVNPDGPRLVAEVVAQAKRWLRDPTSTGPGSPRLGLEVAVRALLADEGAYK